MNIKLRSLLTSFLLMIFPVLVFAGKITNPAFNTGGDIVAETSNIGGKIAIALYAVAGILALFGFIYAGMKYMEGKGDEAFEIGKNVAKGAAIVVMAGGLTQIFT